MMQQPLFQRRKASSDDSLIPLINIVFLLLIFFMVAGKISASQPVRVELPVVDETAAVEESSLEIVLDETGVIAFNGRVVELERLNETLKIALQAAPHTPVMLKADASVQARELTPLLKSIRAAGVEEIRLLARQEQS